MATLFKSKFMRVPDVSFLNTFREIGRNAFIDWMLVLILNLIVVILFISGGAYLYWRVSTGQFVVNVPVNKVEQKVSNEKELNDIIKYFESKEDSAKQAKMGYRGAPDPAI